MKKKSGLYISLGLLLVILVQLNNLKLEWIKDEFSSGIAVGIAIALFVLGIKELRKELKRTNQ